MSSNVAEEQEVPSHWRAMMAPERWAQSTHDTSWGYFEPRIENMDSLEHLETALEIEVSRDEPRPDRVGKLNQRLAEVRE